MIGSASAEFIMHMMAALKAFAESNVSADIGLNSDKWEYRGDYGRKNKLAIRTERNSDTVEFYYRHKKAWNYM